MCGHYTALTECDFFTLLDEYRWYEHLSTLISYPHLFSYHRYAMNLHFESFHSLFYTSFSLPSPCFSLVCISFFFTFPFIIQFLIIASLFVLHLSSPLIPTTRNQSTALTVLYHTPPCETVTPTPKTSPLTPTIIPSLPTFISPILPYPLATSPSCFSIAQKNIRCGRHYKLWFLPSSYTA